MEFKFAVQYITSSNPIWCNEISQSFAKNMIECYVAAQRLLVALLYIIATTLLLAMKLTTLVFPHVINIFQQVVEFHRTQLSIRDMLVEAVFIALISILFIFRRRIRAAWLKFEFEIAKKSRSVAKMLPHMLFFCCAILIAIVGQKFLIPLASLQCLPLFSLFIPAALSANELRLMRTAPQYKLKKKYIYIWVVVATYHTVATLLSLIPLSGRILSRLTEIREVVVILFCWIQVSEQAALWAYECVEPIFTKLMNKIPTVNVDPNQKNFILSMLVAIRVLTPQQELFCRTLLQDGLALIIGLLFVFTPVPILGTLAVGFLIPAYHTSVCDRGPLAVANYKKWMQYWVCYSVLWAAKLYLSLVWSSVVMLASMYLQHSYFNGSARAITLFEEIIVAVSTRHARVPLGTVSPSASANALNEPTLKTSLNECEVPASKPLCGEDKAADEITSHKESRPLLQTDIAETEAKAVEVNPDSTSPIENEDPAAMRNRDDTADEVKSDTLNASIVHKGLKKRRNSKATIGESSS